MSFMTMLGRMLAPGDPRAIMTPGINGRLPAYAQNLPQPQPGQQPSQPMTPGFNPNASMPMGMGMGQGLPGPGQPQGQSTPSSPNPSMIPPRPMQASPQDSSPSPSPMPTMVNPTVPKPVVAESSGPGMANPLAPEDDEELSPTSIAGRRLPPPPAVNMQMPARPGVISPEVQGDMASDYAKQRASIASLPRKQAYGNRFTTAMGLLGGLGADMMASSGNRYVRAASPTTRKVGGMVADAGYNKAMQNWQEQQAVDQGLLGMSTNRAQTLANLDKTDAQADQARAQAELARAKPAMSSRQVPLTDEMAKLYGYSDDDIAEAKATGTPLTGDQRVLNAKIAERRELEKTRLRGESYKEVAKQKIEGNKEIAKAHDEAKKAIAELQEAGKDWRQDAGDEAKMARTKEQTKRAQSIQGQKNVNVDKMMNATTRMETLKTKSYEATLRYQQSATMQAQKALLTDPNNASRIIPPATWQQMANNGDKDAEARLAQYYKELENISKNVTEMHQAVQNSTVAVYGKGTGESPTPAPSSAGKDPMGLFK